MLAHRNAGGSVDEPRMQVDEARERGDQDGERDQHRDDGEGEPEQPARRYAQRHRRCER